MTTAHATYAASVAAAETTRNATELAALTTYETSIDAAKSAVGYNNASGNNATLISTTNSAIIARRNTLLAAETLRQVTIAAARDVLRNTGDVGAT